MVCIYIEIVNNDYLMLQAPQQTFSKYKYQNKESFTRTNI